jgi:hypothetical protein
MWNKPADGGTLRIVDVGGIKLHRAEEPKAIT